MAPNPEQSLREIDEIMSAPERGMVKQWREGRQSAERWKKLRQQLPVLPTISERPTEAPKRLYQQQIRINGGDPTRTMATIAKRYEQAVCKYYDSGACALVKIKKKSEGKYIIGTMPVPEETNSTSRSTHYTLALAMKFPWEELHREDQIDITITNYLYSLFWLEIKIDGSVVQCTFYGAHFSKFQLWWYITLLPFLLGRYQFYGFGDRSSGLLDSHVLELVKLWESVVDAELGETQGRGGQLSDPNDVQVLIDAHINSNQQTPAAVSTSDDIQAQIDARVVETSSTPRFCTQCRSALGEKANFCPQCGAPVRRSK